MNKHLADHDCPEIERGSYPFVISSPPLFFIIPRLFLTINRCGLFSALSFSEEWCSKKTNKEVGKILFDKLQTSCALGQRQAGNICNPQGLQTKLGLQPGNSFTTLRGFQTNQAANNMPLPILI